MKLDFTSLALLVAHHPLPWTWDAAIGEVVDTNFEPVMSIETDSLAFREFLFDLIDAISEELSTQSKPTPPEREEVP